MTLDSEKLEHALDTLADFGMAGILSRVVEPVFGSVIAQAAPELQSRSASERFMADYWALCAALARAFDEPELAEKSAALFFSRAPQLCSSWALSEKVDGRDRLVISDLKILMGAATVDSHEHAAALANAALARSGDSETAKAKKKSKTKGDADSPPPADPSASAFSTLAAQWDRGFSWPDYPPLHSVWSEACEAAQNESGLGSAAFSNLLDAIQSQVKAANNGAIGVVYTGRLMSLAAKSHQGLRLPEDAWPRMSQLLIHSAQQAREQAKTGKDPAQWAKNDNGLSEIGGKLLQRFGQMSGQISERLIEDLLLGAALRSQEGRAGEIAANRMIETCALLFVESAEELLPHHGSTLADTARAAANRLDLAGAGARLGPEAALCFYDRLCLRKPALPSEWDPAMNPETLSWLQQRSLAAAQEPICEVHGARFAQLATRVTRAPADLDRQKALASWLSSAPLRLNPSPESLAAAEAAQALATSRLESPLTQAISAKLADLGLPPPRLLDGFQALLLVVEGFGAPAASLAMAQRAMAPALAALEAQQLQEAMATSERSDSEPSSPSPSKRASRL